MRKTVCFLIVLFLFSCSNQQKNRRVLVPQAIEVLTVDIAAVIKEEYFSGSKVLSNTGRYLDSLGLVNLVEKDSTIKIDLMYAKSDNFTGEILYHDLVEAFLIPQVAEAVVKAQQILKEKHPNYSLIIYDAARPLSVQQKMWDVVKGTSKYKYVANPARGGGLHNYGLAVDASIVNDKNSPLSMGTLVDHFGIEAHITNEDQLIVDGVITLQEKRNRELLRNIMKSVGFYPLASEWWHFNWCSRREAKAKYNCIE